MIPCTSCTVYDSPPTSRPLSFVYLRVFHAPHQMCVLETPPSSSWNGLPPSFPSSSTRLSENVISVLFPQPPAHEERPIAELFANTSEAEPSSQMSRGEGRTLSPPASRPSPADLVPPIATIPETQPSVQMPRADRASRLHQRGKAVRRSPSRGAAMTRRSGRRSSTPPQGVEGTGSVEPSNSGEQEEVPTAPAAGGGGGDGEGIPVRVDVPVSHVARTVECVQVGGSVAGAVAHLEVAPAPPPPRFVDRTVKPAGDGACLDADVSRHGYCSQGGGQAQIHAAEARVGETVTNGPGGVVLAAGDGSDDAVNVAICTGKSLLNGDIPPARSSEQGGTTGGSETRMERVGQGGGHEEVFAESGENKVVVSAWVRDCADEEKVVPATPRQPENKSVPRGEDGGTDAVCRGTSAEEVRQGCWILVGQSERWT